MNLTPPPDNLNPGALVGLTINSDVYEYVAPALDTDMQLRNTVTGGVCYANYRELRALLLPVLRHISTLTQAEAEACWYVAQGHKATVTVAYNEDRGYLVIEDTATGSSLIIDAAGYSEVCTRKVIAIAFRAAALTDYLDSIGMDCRGWLGKGLAVNARSLIK